MQPWLSVAAPLPASVSQTAQRVLFSRAQELQPEKQMVYTSVVVSLGAYIEIYF